jgi:hypothetical protein
MKKYLRKTLQSIAIVAFFFQIISFGMAIYYMMHLESISYPIMHSVDILNCVCFMIIYIAMGCMFKNTSQNKYFLFLLSFLQLCFIILECLRRNSPAGEIGYICASFTNFVIEFYIGINLFKLEDNRYVKNFGLALFINALIWFSLVAVLYIQFVVKNPVLKYIVMSLSIIDQLSCAFIMLGAFWTFKKVQAGFNEIE